LRKATAASGSLISGGNLKTSEYCGVMVSEIIIGSNKLFNLVGFKENNLDESFWVQIHAKGQSFLLCNTYRPQWADNEYWSRLKHAIELNVYIFFRINQKPPPV
jgi:hypothetical protein